MKFNVYAANLLRRTDRRESLQKQFAGRTEFALHVVLTVEMNNGAWGFGRPSGKLLPRKLQGKTVATLCFVRTTTFLLQLTTRKGSFRVLKKPKVWELMYLLAA